jgi:glycosyltransferase involved in cell wall biosynthesis
LNDSFASNRYNSLVKTLPFLDKYLAISQTTGSDLTRLIGIPPSRVDVIMGGIDTHRWPGDVTRIAAPLSITNNAGEIFHLSAPFWLYVGGGDFRKNIKGLIEAFGLLRKAGVSPAPQLVIACHLPTELRDALYAQAKEFALEEGRDLIITGWIDDQSLSLCYRAAFATIFPSLYEGLGLPVLESYFFGTPALASETSSLREITAPECQFDPTNAQSIAGAMLRMHQDPALSAVSLAYGQEMLKRCNWPAIADHVATLLDNDLPKQS